MLNKPKFSIFKNTTYALNGMVEVLKSERSFKTQLAVIAIIAVGLIFVPFSPLSKAIMFISTWLVLIAEAFNSSIERVVDLVTTKHHPLAGQAKDIGAFGVLLAFLMVVAIWGVVIFLEISK